MSEIINSVTECVAVPGTNRTRLTFTGETGSYSFELTPEAIAALMPGLISQPPSPGQSVTVANAISPVGCRPFESVQGLCGLAFDLGERSLHVAVPPNGIDTVRKALAAIEAIYQQRKAPKP